MHPIMVQAAAEELVKMAKAGAIPKWVLPAGIGVAGAGATAAGTAIGHSKGKKTGRKEGLHTGLRVGGRAGYRAGLQKGHAAHARHREILSSLSELTKRHPGGVTLRRDESGRIGYHLTEAAKGKKKAASSIPFGKQVIQGATHMSPKAKSMHMAAGEVLGKDVMYYGNTTADVARNMARDIKGLKSMLQQAFAGKKKAQTAAAIGIPSALAVGAGGGIAIGRASKTGKKKKASAFPVDLFVSLLS